MFDQTLIRICLILGSLITAGYILRRVRLAKVQIEDTIFWLLFSAALLILAIFPGIAYWAANLLGFVSPINFVYVVIIFLLLAKQFFMSIRLSQLDSKVRILTEQVALNPGPNLERQLEKLRESRVRISMDDFGMGHGSLNYLNSAHYDEVKIDGSLIRRLPEHTQTCELVGNIMNMSRILGVSTVAECVETPEQIQMLEKLGCSIYQGYYYSRPLPLDAFIEYVKGL